MKVLLSGGGTGGHVYPAICIGKALEKLAGETTLLFVGTEKGMEMEIVPKEGIEIKTITIRGIKRSLSIDNVKAFFEIFSGLYGSLKIIKDFQPDIVVGTGGYVCGPVLLVAALKGIPTIIHEQNAVPGVTNKILSRFVKRVAVTYKGTEKYFHHQDRVFHSGNPIREGFKIVSKEEGLNELGLNHELPLVLVTGGSLGARKINLSMGLLAKACIESGSFQILHVTGQGTYKEIIEYYKSQGIDDTEAGNLKVVPYLNKMAEALSAADVVVGRAGAGILAEIAVTGCPAIIIPYPFAANNHQEMNARAYEEAGGAIVLLEKQLDEKCLFDEVMLLLEDDKLRVKMSVSGKTYGKLDSADIIAKEAIELVKGQRGKK